MKKQQQNMKYATIDCEFFSNEEIKQIGGISFDNNKNVIKTFDKTISKYQTIEMIKDEFIQFLENIDTLYFWGASNDIKRLKLEFNIDFNKFNIIHFDKVFLKSGLKDNCFSTVHKHYLKNERNGYHNAFIDATYLFDLIKLVDGHNFLNLEFIQKVNNTKIIQYKRETKKIIKRNYIDLKKFSIDKSEIYSINNNWLRIFEVNNSRISQHNFKMLKQELENINYKLFDENYKISSKLKNNLLKNINNNGLSIFIIDDINWNEDFIVKNINNIDIILFLNSKNGKVANFFIKEN